MLTERKVPHISIWILSLFAVALMIPDVIIGNIGQEETVNNFYKSFNGHLTFFLLGVGLLTFQFLLMLKIFKKFDVFFLNSPFYRKFKYINVIFTMATTIFVILLFIQILTGKYYNTSLLTTITTISYLQVIFYMCFLSFKYLKWFSRNKTFNILFYFIWTLAISVTFGFQLLLNDHILLNKPELILSTSMTQWPEFNEGSLEETFSNFYLTSDVISYALLWISTVTLLVDYAKKMGRVKYFIIASLPMIYYLIYYFNLLEYFRGSENFLFFLFFAVNSTWGALLFSYVFLSARKLIKKDRHLREYLLILAAGILMIFTSNQATGIGTSYPPFGILTVSMSGISGYLIFIGTILSSMSLANDKIIKNEIRKKVNSELRLFKDVTTSEEISQLESRILDTVKRNKKTLEENSGIMSNTSDTEILTYINEILDERIANKPNS